MTRRGLTLLVAAALGLVLLFAAALLPVPYIAEVPGPTTDTLGQVQGAPLIDVQGRDVYPTGGKLLLTTVYLQDQVSLPQALRGWVDPDAAVLPRETQFPAGISPEQVTQQNKQAMLDSQGDATIAALRDIGVPVRTRVMVGQVLPGSAADGLVREGDTVTAVDGRPVSTDTELRAAIRTRRPGDRVSLTVLRDGVPVTSDLVTQPSGEPPVPVVGLLTSERPDGLPFTVDIRLEDVGGPSAGLMFALGIIDKLTPGDLTAGDVVAGTGVIDADGVVGPIGGIHQKLVGAKDAGATVFLVPSGNCAEAVEDAPADLQLVRVADLEDARGALQALHTPGAPPPPLCG